MTIQKRKALRLKDYDYSENGYYFITICTSGRKILFGDCGNKRVARDVVEAVFQETVSWHRNVQCLKYVLMPNHMHAILALKDADVSLSEFVSSFKKRSVAAYSVYVREGKLPPYHGSIWQRSFYDEVIRGEEHFQNVWTYIENNPLQWEMDAYFLG